MIQKFGVKVCYAPIHDNTMCLTRLLCGVCLGSFFLLEREEKFHSLNECCDDEMQNYAN